MMKQIKDIYPEAIRLNLPLLSVYNAEFWDEYLSEHERYDSLFRRLYKSYRFYDQECDEDIETVTRRWIDACYEHLLINDKKYTELYRMYVIPDDKYSITDNYNMVEVMDRDTTSNSTAVLGARSDSNSTTQGAQSNNSTGKVSPYDSEQFYNNSSLEENSGSRTDTGSFSKGEETDTSNNQGTENYTLTRKGNIGVQTGTDMLDKHQNLWSRYEFYAYIFREICAALLLV